MNLLDAWTFDSGLYLVNVAVAATLACASALAAARVLKSRPAPVRYGVLLAAMMLALLSPGVAWTARALGLSPLCISAPGPNAGPARQRDMSFSVEVEGPAVLGMPFRMRGLALNPGDVPKEVRVERSEINLLLEASGEAKHQEVFDGYWQPPQWQEKAVVPPGKEVTCFDCMVPTGERWGTGPILARGEARISWTAWVRKGDRFESQTVTSKPFQILLDPPKGKVVDFAVNGVRVELEAVNKTVKSRKEVRFRVGLRNVGQNAIHISGREKFDDNYCAFLIYAPGERQPVREALPWPTRNTDGFDIAPGQVVTREFTAHWGHVQGPQFSGGGGQRGETTFLTPGTYHVVVFFKGEDNTPAKRSWVGYARSNTVTVELVAPPGAEPAAQQPNPAHPPATYVGLSGTGPQPQPYHNVQAGRSDMDFVTEPAWGEAVGGVQVRVRAERREWKAGETPTLMLDVANRDSGSVVVHYLPGVASRVEIDGWWYSWTEQIEITISTPRAWLSKGSQTSKALEIHLSDKWGPHVERDKADLQGRPQPNSPGLRLAPGRHKVRVSFCPDTAYGYREPPSAVSNAVEIEILPAEVAPPAASPPKAPEPLAGPVRRPQDDGSDELLPGSDVSLEKAIKDTFAFVAVCESLDELHQKPRTLPTTPFFQTFRVLAVLRGRPPREETVEFQSLRPGGTDGRERRISKGERFIWVVRHGALPGGNPGLLGVKALADTPGNRQAVENSIAPGAPPEVREQMWRLCSQYVEDRVRGAEMLGEMRAIEAVPLLIERLDDDTRFIPGVPRGTPLVRSVSQAAGRSLVAIGEAAVDPLKAALKHDKPIIRVRSARLLVEMGQPDGRETLLTAANDRTFDAKARWEALDALADLGVRDIVPTLIEELKLGSMFWAPMLLGRLGDERATEPLAEVLRAPQDVSVSALEAVIEALGKIGKAPKDLDGMLAALKNKRREVRSETARALGHLGDRRAVPSLVEALHDPDPVVRRHASRAVGEIGDASALPPLRQLLRDESPDVVKEAAEAIKRIESAGRNTAPAPPAEGLESAL